MCGILSEITKCAKKKENGTHNEKKSIKSDTEMTQMMYLIEKDIKIVIVAVSICSKKQRKDTSSRHRKNTKKTKSNHFCK